jgi:hypothetical protein
LQKATPLGREISTLVYVVAEREAHVSRTRFWHPLPHNRKVLARGQARRGRPVVVAGGPALIDPMLQAVEGGSAKDTRV